MKSAPETFSRRFAQSAQSRWLVALCVLAIAAATALPGYLGGQWGWAQPPQVVYLAQVQALRQQGLAVPGWQTLSREEIRIGVRRWVMQALGPSDSSHQNLPASASPILLLRPQMEPSDAPEIDWVSFSGEFGLRVDSRQPLRFTAAGSAGQTVPVEARFSRHWNADQTYAVVQWYAWPTGGSADPGRWFWADQRLQWTQQQRMPWVAIGLLIPMEPLGDVADVRADAQTLAEAVQSALMAGAFQ